MPKIVSFQIWHLMPTWFTISFRCWKILSRYLPFRFGPVVAILKTKLSLPKDQKFTIIDSLISRQHPSQAPISLPHGPELQLPHSHPQKDAFHYSGDCFHSPPTITAAASIKWALAKPCEPMRSNQAFVSLSRRQYHYILLQFEFLTSYNHYEAHVCVK